MFSYSEAIKELIDNNDVEKTLKRGSSYKREVKYLQNVLFELGYGDLLKWDRFGADGDYGGSTTLAVQTFADQNGFKESDGRSVTEDLAKKMLQRYDFLDELRHIQAAIDKPSLLAQLYKGTNNQVATTVLQNILFELGFGKEMNWERWGADGDYGNGTSSAVLAFAKRHRLEGDGTKITKKIALQSLAVFTPAYGKEWNKNIPEDDDKNGGLDVSISVRGSRKKVTVSDDEDSKVFGSYKKGVFTVGNQKAQDFIDANKEQLKSFGLTESAMNVMVAVSKNEGNLDAINTWDNSFMTFGMFQWTIGARSDKGELAALLKKIKDVNPEKFKALFGDYGLDVTSDTNHYNGYFTLDGVLLKSSTAKEKMRTYEWAFRFWKAGQDDLVKAIEIEHALSRLDIFYASDRYKINGKYHVKDVITSEFGVGLVLDNHVNRPGYIRPCIERAINGVGLQDKNPKEWTTADEAKVISKYIDVRATYGSSPMTHADKRAEVTRSFLRAGKISDQRGSFKLEEEEIVAVDPVVVNPLISEEDREDNTEEQEEDNLTNQ